MADNIQEYAQIAKDTAARLTSSLQEWTAFLATAARLYKYPYHEQLMIYAQRPEATACASYDLWNKRMGRYIRRGSKGIALIDTAGDNPKIKYVFDVADTGRTDLSRHVSLWEYRPEHAEAVSSMLEHHYNVTPDGIEEQLEKVAAQLAGEYWDTHQQDILGIVDGSFLEGYDDFNVGVAFRNAAMVSITYSLLSRCGLEPEDYFEHEDFLSVFDWNTPEAVAELGTAVSTIDQEVLRQIEIAIKQYEREHSAERTEQHDKQPDLQNQRGLSDPQPQIDRAAGAGIRQVREDAEEISSGKQAGALQPPDSLGEAASAPAGDRPNGAPALGADGSRTGEKGRSDGGTEIQRPDEVGRADEHLQGAGGGNHSERVDFQLEAPIIGEQMSLFPSEAQQIQSITEAESVQNTPFAFSISDEEFAHVLRLGGNSEQSRMRIVTEFSKRKNADELVPFLQKLYHGGNGFHMENGDKTAPHQRIVALS